MFQDVVVKSCTITPILILHNCEKCIRCTDGKVHGHVNARPLGFVASFVGTQHIFSVLCQTVPEHISEEYNIVWLTAMGHYMWRGVPAPLLLPLQWGSYRKIFKKVGVKWDQKHVLMGSGGIGLSQC